MSSLGCKYPSPPPHIHKKYMYSYPVSSSSYDWLLEVSGLAMPDLTQAQGLCLVQLSRLPSPRPLDLLRPPTDTQFLVGEIQREQNQGLALMVLTFQGGLIGKYLGILLICRPLALSLPNLLVLQGPGQGPPPWCRLPGKPAFTSSLHADFHLLLCVAVSCFILSTTVLLFISSSLRP